MDLERVFNESIVYAKGIGLNSDGKDAWVFDVDETLLSNLPYYTNHGYGLELFDSLEFDKWVEKAMTPPVGTSLKLYKEVLRLGFKVFLLTGRRETQKGVTVENLMNAGFRDWDKLILRLVFHLYPELGYYQITRLISFVSCYYLNEKSMKLHVEYYGLADL